jgi:hypothetical protein
VLVELVEVHEPLVVLVVVPVVERRFAVCANITLATSITRKIESIVFFKAPPKPPLIALSKNSLLLRGTGLGNVSVRGM